MLNSAAVKGTLEKNMKTKFFQSGLLWSWVIVLVFVLDRLSKFVVVNALKEYEPVQIFSFFNLTLAYNKGAAFSFLNRATGWQTWFFGAIAILISVVLLVWLRKLSAKQRWISIALSLIIGGALGNLFDRIYYGQVIDFIQLHLSHYYWPVFNIADSAVCIGAVMLLWEMMMKEKT